MGCTILQMDMSAYPAEWQGLWHITHVMKSMSYKEVVKGYVAMGAGQELSHNVQVRNERGFNI